MVDKAGRVLYVVLGAAIADDADPELPEIRILRGACNAVYDQAGEGHPGRPPRVDRVRPRGCRAPGRRPRAPQSGERRVRPGREDAQPAHRLVRLRAAAWEC